MMMKYFYSLLIYPVEKPIPKSVMKQQNDKISVFLVDDEVHGLAALTDLIDQMDNAEICGKARSVADAIKVVNETSPSVLVLDYHLSDGTAMDICDALKIKHKSIIVSADELIKEKINEKGIPFLNKPVGMSELEKIINTFN